MSEELETGGGLELPADWRELSPEAKKVLLHKLRGLHISLGLGGPRKWRGVARPKQLSPDDPMHHLPDGNGFACGCSGPDNGWNIWMFMAGRGVGKHGPALTGSSSRRCGTREPCGRLSPLRSGTCASRASRDRRVSGGS